QRISLYGGGAPERRGLDGVTRSFDTRAISWTVERALVHRCRVGGRRLAGAVLSGAGERENGIDRAGGGCPGRRHSDGRHCFRGRLSRLLAIVRICSGRGRRVVDFAGGRRWGTSGRIGLGGGVRRRL